MPVTAFKKANIPFLLGGDGELAVDTGALLPNQPLPETAPALLNVAFKAAGAQDVLLGQDESLKLAVSAQARVRLAAIFKSTTGEPAALLAANGLGDFFADPANAGKLVLGFDVGASTAVTAAGSFRYAALSAAGQLDAGADGGYTYLRALDKGLPLVQLLPAFFEKMRLPEQGTTAPEPGEAISLRYGGYLRLSAEVAAGYRLAGTKSFSLGELALSEKYDLSILGKVGLAAGVAGRFSILVTAADRRDWARVVVRRHRAADFKIAADVNVGFRNQLAGLPGCADEFLGAALGVNARNFLNVFQKARELSDFNAFKQKIDGLARSYIAEFVGKGFDALESVPEFTAFLGRVEKVVTSYDQLEDRAVALFDRYFDLQDKLTGFLNRIRSLASLQPLAGKLDEHSWNMLSQLTDGDPLAFLLKPDSLGKLKERAGSVLALISDPAHQELRSLVHLAKTQFGIGKFFAELGRLDTPEKLEALADQKLGQFVTRLTGLALDSDPNIRKAFNQVRAVLDRIDSFKNTLFRKFQEASSASYKAALHAEFSRAGEQDALVDVLVNLADPRGPDLLREAGRGDFERILTLGDTTAVIVREGVFTHRTTRQSAFQVNIVGWHLNYQYSGFDRVITESEQRLVPSERGMTVHSSQVLEVGRMRRRNDEQMQANLLLRALGESAKVVPSDGKGLEYFIDTLSTLAARFELSFDDRDTTDAELKDYLAFAKQLGLDAQGAAFDALAPLLPRNARGSFGPLSLCYDVRFVEESIAALLSVKQVDDAAEAQIRSAMRRMVLANYRKDEGLRDTAYAYATPAVYDRFRELGFAAFVPPSPRQESIAPGIPGLSAPAKVTLQPNAYRLLVTLFNIEDSLIKAIRDLVKLLASGKPMKPQDFAKKAERFGNALNEFDNFDQAAGTDADGAATVFTVFETLVRLASAGEPKLAATLRLRSKVEGKEVEKVFLSGVATV